MLELLRLARILRVIIRYRLDSLALGASNLPFSRTLPKLFPWNWIKRAEETPGVRIRLALEELGSIFVKFGQILSTRRDLLPPEIADELAKLQDQVPPFPGVQAMATVEQSLRQPISELFSRFDQTPLASASIAQVHAAELRDGTQVVIKVLRPHIERDIKRDIALLYLIGSLVQRLYRDARRFKPMAMIAEYEASLLDELDLLREAANANQIRRDFADTNMLHIPKVHWDYCHKDVMVMERIQGIPVNDRGALLARGIDLKRLAENGVEIFFRQVFRHNFFHADMHPGNIFVSPEGNYIAVDFGIVGTLNEQDQYYLIENFIAFFNRDYRAVAEYHLRAGWIPPDTRVEQFEAAIRSLCEPILDRPLMEISFGQTLLRLMQVARKFHMEVQPQLLLLQKTLLNVEGLGRQLYPELDIWQTARPFIERWMNEKIGWRAFLRHSRRELPKLVPVLPKLPMLLHDLAERAMHGNLETQHRSAQWEQLQKQLERNRKTMARGFLASALLIGAALLAALDRSASLVWGLPPLSWLLGLAAAFLLWFDRLR